MTDEITPDLASRPPHRQVENARAVLEVGLLVLVSGALLLLTETAPTAGLVLAVTASIGLLLAHSVGVEVDEEEIEIRLGNGWRRRRVRLEDVEEIVVRTDEGPLFALGWSADGAEVAYGLGGRARVDVRLADSRIVIALDAATDLAAALEARRPRAPRIHEGVDPA